MININLSILRQTKILTLNVIKELILKKIQNAFHNDKICHSYESKLPGSVW